jgi:hypothetical protein
VDLRRQDSQGSASISGRFDSIKSVSTNRLIMGDYNHPILSDKLTTYEGQIYF